MDRLKLKRSALVLLVVVLGSRATFAQAPVEPPQVIASGEGSVKAVPDRAWITIGAESRAKVSKDAQQRNAEAMTAIQQKISGFGISKDAVRTTAIDLQPEFDYVNGRQTPRGYVARNTIEVRIDDLTKIGDIIDAVVGSGATTLQGLRFDVKDRTSLQQAALQSAVKDAMARAQAIAAGAGRSLDRVLRIEEQFVGGGAEPVVRQMAMAKADAGTPVAAGEIEIRAQVRVSVAIK